MSVPEPTSEQCTAKAVVFEDADRIGHAIWYPQMGGYVGKAVAIFDKTWTETGHGSTVGGCIDMLVWHDGEFPFSEDDDGTKPKHLHHCDPEQFIEFGQALAEINERGRKSID